MDEYMESMMEAVCERCAVLEAYEDHDDVLETFCRECHAEAACRAVLSEAYADGFRAGRKYGFVHARREQARLVRHSQSPVEARNE